MLPASLIGKVGGAAAETHSVTEAPGLAKLLEMELAPDGVAYLTELGQAVLHAILEMRGK
jgi:hypothetical protein